MVNADALPAALAPEALQPPHRNAVPFDNRYASLIVDGVSVD